MNASQQAGQSQGPTAGLSESQKQQIIEHFRGMTNEARVLSQKVQELMADQREHALVLETLAPLDKSRKAWRKVGGVLVERTVGQAEEAVKTNHASISQLLAEVQSKYEQKAAECEAFQRRFQISTNGMPPPPPLEEEATRK